MQKICAEFNPCPSPERAMVESVQVVVMLHPATPRGFLGWHSRRLSGGLVCASRQVKPPPGNRIASVGFALGDVPSRIAVSAALQGPKLVKFLPGKLNRLLNPDPAGVGVRYIHQSVPRVVGVAGSLPVSEHLDVGIPRQREEEQRRLALGHGKH